MAEEGKTWYFPSTCISSTSHHISSVQHILLSHPFLLSLSFLTAKQTVARWCFRWGSRKTPPFAPNTDSPSVTRRRDPTSPSRSDDPTPLNASAHCHFSRPRQCLLYGNAQTIRRRLRHPPAVSGGTPAGRGESASH